MVEQDNIWQRFINYKNLRDEEIKATITVLKELIRLDEPFTNIINLNPHHENYNEYTTIVDALQIYHSSQIDIIKALVEELESNVNGLD